MFKNIRFFLIYSDTKGDAENISVLTWTDVLINSRIQTWNDLLLIFGGNSDLSESYCLGNRSITVIIIAIATSVVGNQNFEC